MSCSSSNLTEKRSLTEDLNVQIKKIKVDDASFEQKTPVPAVEREAQPKFISAAELAMPLPEISDEELLEMALELERRCGN